MGTMKTANQDTSSEWNLDKSTELALAFLASDERRRVSGMRIQNELESLKDSASAGFEILRRDGAALLSALVAEQTH